MATPLELSKIRSNPIKEGLDPFSRLFELTRVGLGIIASLDVVHALFSIAVTIGNAPFLWYIIC
jgi:hypothetical protein